MWSRPKDIHLANRTLFIIFQGKNSLIIAMLMVRISTYNKAYFRKSITINIPNLRHAELTCIRNPL